MNIIKWVGSLWLAGMLVSCQSDDPKTTIVSRIKQASKLSTVEYVMTKVVVGSQDKKFLGIIKLKNSVFLAQTEATLKLGIDLSKLTPDKVVLDGSSVYVTLPPVEVINFSYPAEKFEVDEDYSQDSWFNSFTPETIDAFYEAAEVDIREKINFLPLRESTEDKTKLLVEGLLRQAGFQEVYIDFDTTSVDLLTIPVAQVDQLN